MTKSRLRKSGVRAQVSRYSHFSGPVEMEGRCVHSHQNYTFTFHFCTNFDSLNVSFFLDCETGIHPKSSHPHEKLLLLYNACLTQIYFCEHIVCIHTSTAPPQPLCRIMVWISFHGIWNNWARWILHIRLSSTTQLIICLFRVLRIGMFFQKLLLS